MTTATAGPTLGTRAPAVLWFRRDLRLADNPALAAAADRGRDVVGTVVADPALLGPAGPRRRDFLAGCIDTLQAAVDGAIAVRSGDPVTAIARLAREVDADTVVAAADCGPYGRRRDAAVAAALAASGVGFELVGSPYAVPPGTVRTRGGSPFQVFTPFHRAWTAHGWDRPIDPPPVRWVRDLPSDQWPDSAGSGPPKSRFMPGESAAWRQAEAFLERVASYDADRDRPDLDRTSRLSPYLRFGCLHPRQLLDRLGERSGEVSYRKELCWREFYADVLHHRPDSARAVLQPRMARLAVDDGPDADRRFEAWASGQTGYPLIDAGMRQLLAEGWLPNRVRMLAASFLVKDLHLDWRRGARFFMTHLVDGDLASNNHGWQWTAGTGTDAAPFHRVFNPTLQAARFDPQGTYIRAWVPELAHLAPPEVHEPWTAAAGPPAGYPAPIVDHQIERAEALARFAATGTG